ncbi:MAG: guaD [Rhodospirillales bacterium]|nr:guaD [Rhodospirillales bacterium]
MSDEAFLRRAIELSRAGMESNEGGPFGAVVVRDGKILGEGWNRVVASGDPTAHAEVTAIRNAAAAAGHFDLSGAIIYASCEPCPMCLAAIHWARIGRIVYAAACGDAAAIGFDDGAILDELCRAPDQRRVVAEQSLQDEAAAVMRDWAAKADRTPY